MTRERPTADARIKAALWFADRGFGVFTVWSANDAGVCRCPDGAKCSSPGKHPITPNGFQDATTDPQRIRTLLSAGSQPNYGLVCPDGVFALDVDEEGDGDGLARFARLEATYGPLPPTLRTNTANGQHVFLRWPEGHPRPLKKMFGYVTRWGSGRQAGYVIGPRSVHPSGVEYTPGAAGLEIATLPEEWARAALEGEGPTAVIGGPKALPERGGRHDWLRDRARYYRGVIDDPDILRATLMAENARLAEPKTADEVERAIGDVFAKFPPDPPEVVEERAAVRLGEDDLDLLGVPQSGAFPEPPAREAFGGLLGELVDDLVDGTDASEVGLLGAVIAFTGALIPGYAYFHRDQTSSPFVALVGESAIGRKGTAMIRVMDAMSDALEKQTVHRVVLDGVNSGEGLVSTLSYRREHFSTEPTVGLIFEEEYATLLASRGREGSTLDPKMRQAFDGSPLSNRKAGETKTVMPPYWLPALIGITPVELRQRLEPGALQSGSANRWLYLPVIRRAVTPTNASPRFDQEHREAVAAAHRASQRVPALLQVEPAVTRELAEYADFLPGASAGLARDLTRRLGIIAFRVALVHALIERSVTVTADHLHRAMALTEYARRGIDWVFGDTIGNPDANLLFRHLDAAGRLSRRAITQGIVRDPIRRQAAIDELVRLGRAQVMTVQTGGRPRTELARGVSGGAFVQFRSDTDDAQKVHESAQDDPSEAFVHSVQGSATERDDYGKPARNAQKVDSEREPSAQKVHESRTELHVSGQNSAEWSSPCHFYVDHQRAHRQTPDGWVCDICRKEDPA